MSYSNPIIPGFHPDPSICRVGDDYYLATSTFEYFPGVPIFHSTDLIHWEQIGHCLTRESQLPLQGCRSSGGIYAPTIRHQDGIFYMTTTNVTGGGNFFVTATDPAGPWSEPIWVDAGGIDPSFFFDDDGSVYYQTSHDSESGKPYLYAQSIGRPESASARPAPSGRAQADPGPEGPHLYKKDGWYYLMIAEGGTEMGHMETIARSRDIWGPYESCPHNPILSHRYRSSVIQGTGHADLVEAPDGSWWMVFLAFRLSSHGLHHLGRETFLAPVTWTEDGWPVVYNGKAIELKMPIDPPGIEKDPESPTQAFFDGFDRDVLDLSWNFLRTPSDVHWSLAENPGTLTLRGNSYTLDDTAAPAFVGRRQTDFCCTAAVHLDASGLADGDEAGLTVFYNEMAHYDLGVHCGNGEKTIRLRRVAADMDIIVAEHPLEDARVTLVVESDRSRYHFGFGQTKDQAVTNPIGSGSSRLLSTEVYPMSFTGVYIGLYATTSHGDCGGPALFDDFSYVPYLYRTRDGKGFSYRPDTPIGTVLADSTARKVLDELLPGFTERLNPSAHSIFLPVEAGIRQLAPDAPDWRVRKVLDRLTTP